MSVVSGRVSNTSIKNNHKDINVRFTYRCKCTQHKIHLSLLSHQYL